MEYFRKYVYDVTLVFYIIASFIKIFSPSFSRQFFHFCLLFSYYFQIFAIILLVLFISVKICYPKFSLILSVFHLKESALQLISLISYLMLILCYWLPSQFSLFPLLQKYTQLDISDTEVLIPTYCVEFFQVKSCQSKKCGLNCRDICRLSSYVQDFFNRGQISSCAPLSSSPH